MPRVSIVSLSILGVLLAAAPVPAGDATGQARREGRCGTSRPELEARRDAIAAKVRQMRATPRGGSGDFGEIAVIEDDGTLVVDGVSNSDEIVRRFALTHPDQYGQVVIHFDFPMSPELGFAFEHNIANDVQGIGLPLFNDGATYGTTNLASYVNMNDLPEFPTFAPYAPVLAHESSHRFAARVDTGTCGTFLLSTICVHWNFYHHTAGSFLYGHSWTDNGDGTFTSSGARTTFGELDEYLMGLRDTSAITQPLFVIENPRSCFKNGNPIACPDRNTYPDDGYTVTGDRTDFTMADIVAVHGPRVPDAASAPHTFRLAMVLVVAQGQYPPALGSLTKLDGYRQQFEPYFAAATDGLGAVETRLYLPGEPPHPAFSASTTQTIPGAAIQLTDDTRNGPPTSWLWTFGDGATSALQNPVHAYAAPGVYDVALTVANANGSETRTRMAYIDVQVRPPVADFEVDVTMGVAPLAVQFTDRSTWTPAAWLWEFGDGATSTVQSPSHVYVTPNAAFLVKLTATNAHGQNVRGRPNYVVTGTRIYRETFDAGAPSWTHGATSGTDDWAVGPPQGNGGDPPAAHQGTGVFGTDLGGVTEGKYTPRVDSWLLSPGIDASAATHVALTYWRWLTVEDGLYDVADVSVNGTRYYQNPIGTGVDQFTDWSWHPEVFDITDDAAGDPAFTVRFSLKSDDQIEFGGWNVDDLAVYSLPAGPYWEGPRILAGPGHGAGNPNQVSLLDGLGRRQVSWLAYGAGTMGTNAAGADVDGDGFREALTAPGPGLTLGPHVRAFNPWDGSPIAKVSYYAYGTLRYGANVAGGRLDADRFDEIATGPGAGAVFGPHVRGWNVDGGTPAAVAKVNYFAYGTLRYGCLLALGDVDTEAAYTEIVTGPGPGAVFGAHLRGWNYDDTAVTPLPNFSTFAFTASTYGLNVGTANLAGQVREEVLVGKGPAPTNPAELKAMNYGAGTLGTLGNSTLVPFPTLYGVRVAGGDMGADGHHMVAGPGPSPSAGGQLRGYTYAVANPPGWRSDANLDVTVFALPYGASAAVGNIQ